MTAPPSVNLVAQQTVSSDIGDYADRNDIIQLLNVDLSPYMSNGVVYHRYRIETLQTGFHRVWAPRAVSEGERQELYRRWHARQPRTSIFQKS